MRVDEYDNNKKSLCMSQKADRIFESSIWTRPGVRKNIQDTHAAALYELPFPLSAYSIER